MKRKFYRRPSVRGRPTAWRKAMPISGFLFRKPRWVSAFTRRRAEPRCSGDRRHDHRWPPRLCAGALVEDLPRPHGRDLSSG